MRFGRIVAIVAFTCVFALPQWVTGARKQPTPAEAAQSELVQASKARLRALNYFELAALDRLTHRDYIGTADDGGTMTKEVLLKKYAPHSAEPPNTYGQMQDLQVHIYGNMGILNYRIGLTQRFGDRNIINTMRRTDVFMKDEGRWQAISTQITVIPVSYLTPVAAGATRYDDYVGEYAITADNVDRVTHEGGKLMGETAGGKEEFLPLGEEKFFFREDTGQVTFTRDGSGRVTGYAYQRCDGQKILARKIK